MGLPLVGAQRQSRVATHALLRTRIERKCVEDTELAEIENVAASRGIAPIFLVGIGYMRAVIDAEVTWLQKFVGDVESGRISWLDAHTALSRHPKDTA
ncbi:hypothetical protein [Rhodococcoides kyotonense]|uniref:Uncharacterized protein n=1 Tax=Rhodococcoides kyotonense TaxID=398843 RepID=A0A239I2P2_9NOCA|nr:hypothetical protein [Rhodococcus kyotonensis]SNS87642.1 hypothetical protein SAMN05421642_106172 [Rhodococcus kyotonensis]